jgi:hypothetical protein
VARAKQERAAFGSRGEEKGGEGKWEKKKGRRKRGKKKGNRREKGRGASAPIAAATAVGRPRASVDRALREKHSIAPALIAESGHA